MTEVYGKIVPIEKMDALINYKIKLGREVDIEDVKQLSEIKNAYSLKQILKNFQDQAN